MATATRTRSTAKTRSTTARSGTQTRQSTEARASPFVGMKAPGVRAFQQATERFERIGANPERGQILYWVAQAGGQAVTKEELMEVGKFGEDGIGQHLLALTRGKLLAKSGEGYTLTPDGQVIAAPITHWINGGNSGGG